MMNASTTVCPVAARKSMPPATVPIHMPTPAGQVLKGALQARTASQPITAPARNGQAVAKTPVSTSARWCASRPMAAKTRMRIASASPAMRAVRTRADFAEGMETTLSRTDAELEPKVLRMPPGSEPAPLEPALGTAEDVATTLESTPIPGGTT